MNFKDSVQISLLISFMLWLIAKILEGFFMEASLSWIDFWQVSILWVIFVCLITDKIRIFLGHFFGVFIPIAIISQVIIFIIVGGSMADADWDRERTIYLFWRIIILMEFLLLLFSLIFSLVEATKEVNRLKQVEKIK